jgi:hypothetical protein
MLQAAADTTVKEPKTMMLFPEMCSDYPCTNGVNPTVHTMVDHIRS